MNFEIICQSISKTQSVSKPTACCGFVVVVTTCRCSLFCVFVVQFYIVIPLPVAWWSGCGEFSSFLFWPALSAVRWRQPLRRCVLSSSQPSIKSLHHLARWLILDRSAHSYSYCRVVCKWQELTQRTIAS